MAFVIDASARRIVGWKVATSMSTDLVLDAIKQAVFARRREGVKDLTGFIHHNDPVNIQLFVSERFVVAGIEASIGTVGDAHGNALAESINGLYKTELINPGKPWRNATQVEVEAAAYLRWFNNDRLYEFCRNIPPVELARNFHRQVAADTAA